MKSLLFLRLGLTMLALAFGEWRVRRIAKAMEQEHGLPRGWLLQPGNAERFAAWERARAIWRRAAASAA